MGWKDDFNQALLRLVQDYRDTDDAVEVTGFEQETRPGWKYSTWTEDPAETVIMITYRTAAGWSRELEWHGDFGELIDKLTEE